MLASLCAAASPQVIATTRLRCDADRWVLLGLVVHAAVMVATLALPLPLAVGIIGVAMVWGSNTISHIHLHTPLFTDAAANRALTLYLTMALGVPQTLWRHRHLVHHARHAERVPSLDRGAVAMEVVVVGGVVGLLVFAGAFLPWLLGIALGYALCALQGRMEHLAGVHDGWSTYDRWHNRLWFNDGHHAEHHRFPGVHWSELPSRRLADARTTRHGPLLRGLAPRPWLLAWLERLTAIDVIGGAVVRAHVRATAAVLARTEVQRVLIVGGGLFPRTAIVMHRLRPGAACVIVDADAGHLERARAELAARGIAAELRHGFWDGDDAGADLVSLPLALRGMRVEGRAPRLVHAWIWERARGRPTAVVAWWLLKRVVLV